MRHVRGGGLVCAVVLMTASQSHADKPDVGQILRFTPTQPGVVYDTPTEEFYPKCAVDITDGKSRGFLVRDHRGLVIRRFVDTNGDGKVDRWSYYMNGLEVYRDVDSNLNGRADEYRYYNTAGSRWGLDQNEDGKVDQWKSISAEEATAEVIAAVGARDFNRLKALLLDASDLKELGLSEASVARVAKAQEMAGSMFQQLAQNLGTDIQWSRFDGHNPVRIPAEEISSEADLTLYLNGTILLEVAGDTKWLRVPELVRVGDTWKLSSAPTQIQQNQPLTTEGIIVTGIPDVVTGQEGDDGGGVVENDDEIRELVANLREHDETIPRDPTDADNLVAYHLKRAEICARVGAKSKKLSNREHWYRQVADSLNAAVQTGKYDKGVATLQQYGDQFAKVDWGKSLAAYFIYRAMNSEYAVKLASEADPSNLQSDFMSKLQDFLTDYPEAPDAADALWQLGNGSELTSKEDEAIRYYDELVTKNPDSPFAMKAKGALRRLESVGQPLRMTSTGLGQKPVDTAQYKGKVLLISYWATWCDPCVEEMDRLSSLREKYARAGFEIIGVSLDQDKAKAVEFLRQKGYGWPQMFEEGGMESKLATELGIISLPYLMLVDSNGIVLNKNVQFGELESELSKVMTPANVANRNRESDKN